MTENDENLLFSEESSSSASFESKDMIFVSDSIPQNGWRLFGIIPKKLITVNLRFLYIALLAIVAISFFLIPIIVFPVGTALTKPLMTLINGMKRFSTGDFGVEIEVKSGDEIEELALVFNRMVKDAKMNVEKMLEQEKKEREIELQLFLARINPHFVYNTLNTIVYLARKINASEIVQVTKSFLEILHQSLHTSADVTTTFNEEMIYINHYIAIMKFRYSDAINIIWQVEPSLYDAQIHRLLLYPLVENSIFHGISPNGAGEVIVKVEDANKQIRISVIDNGTGIEPEKLKMIQSSLEKSKDFSIGKHIGLKNVNGRLFLLYGHESQLHIESHIGVRTTVWFLIPKTDMDHLDGPAGGLPPLE